MLYHQLSHSTAAIKAELENLVGGHDLSIFIRGQLWVAKDSTADSYHNYAKYVNHLITSIQKNVD
jgi:hypothetical protein